jgi:cytochrome c biogenesis protein CcmG, thiol:disulfide interchange protein DsbE
MKKIISLSILSIFVFTAFTTIKNNSIPSASLKKTDGTIINSNSITNDGKPMIISFWATWCVPCKKELDAIHKNYTEWQKETGVKLIAISIDDSTRTEKIAPMIIAKGWNYDVYVDFKKELQKAMNVSNVPHTFLIDGNGKIVWSHNSYKEGDENHLFELVKKVSKGEEISE